MSQRTHICETPSKDFLFLYNYIKTLFASAFLANGNGVTNIKTRETKTPSEQASLEVEN